MNKKCQIFASSLIEKNMDFLLKKKCHPDRFETTDKRDLAEELFQQLQENRYNLKGLQELEERINSL